MFTYVQNKIILAWSFVLHPDLFDDLTVYFLSLQEFSPTPEFDTVSIMLKNQASCRIHGEYSGLCNFIIVDIVVLLLLNSISRIFMAALSRGYLRFFTVDG